ncbi:MAG: PAS domain-containing protein [Candidatus Velamenicoccus archaeovorus]
MSEGSDTRTRIPTGLLEGVVRAEAAARTLGDVLPVILYVEVDDPEGTDLFTSPQIEQVLGPAEGGDLGELRRSRIHPDDLERVARERRRARELGRPIRTEYRLLASDGREVWIRDIADPVADTEGRTLYWRGVLADVTERRQAMERLRASETLRWQTLEERRSLVARMEAALDDERRRIAADLHDDSIQVISAADLQLQALLTIADDPDLGGGLRDVHETLMLAVDRLRNLLVELRPPAMSPEGLEVALRTYLEEFRFPVTWTVEAELAEEPPADVGAIVFRIAQEALTNAGKHAEASRLDVRVGDADRGILLRVADDGRGFDARGPERSEPGHIGLLSMVERAELAGGWCRITSTPGHGTVVEAWLPLRPPAVEVSQPGG